LNEKSIRSPTESARTYRFHTQQVPVIRWLVSQADPTSAYIHTYIPTVCRHHLYLHFTGHETRPWTKLPSLEHAERKDATSLKSTASSHLKSMNHQSMGACSPITRPSRHDPQNGPHIHLDFFFFLLPFLFFFPAPSAASTPAAAPSAPSPETAWVSEATSLNSASTIADPDRSAGAG